MSNEQEITISRKDYEKIAALAQNLETDTGALLEEELARAKIIDLEKAPHNVVAMGSVVSFLDEAKNQSSTVELLYPHEMNKESAYQKISVLAPVGAALIGLAVGHTIDWPLPSGKTKHLKVISVTNPNE